MKKYGVDALRCCLMFIGPWEHGGNWTDKSIVGIARWLSRVWGCVPMTEREETNPAPSGKITEHDEELARLCHCTTKRIVGDMRQFKFNTVIAALMEMTSGIIRLYKKGVSAKAYNDALDRMIKHIAPLAPHIAEELWERNGHSESVHLQSTPEYDEELVNSETVTVIVQVNGKVRDKLSLPTGTAEKEAVAAAKASEKAARFLTQNGIVKAIYIPDRLVNLVVKD